MSGYKRVNFYELCRLCATNQQKEKTHIFQEEGRKIQLQTKIQSCLSLTVCENDFLPKVVCSKCLRTLEVCYSFRQECVTSESMLSSYFKNFRYTEDFKKSGKVYIKDTTPKCPATTPQFTQPVEAPPITAPSTYVEAKPLEQVPFYTLQLPTIVTNQIDKIKPDNSKILHQPQQQNPVPAYNLNTINLAAIKTMPKAPTEGLSNVVVNANGEVLNIAQLVDFESIINHHQQPKIKVGNGKVMRKKDVEEPLIKIDLTNNDIDSFDKHNHLIKTNNNQNKFAYAIKVEDNNKVNSNSVIFNNLTEFNHSSQNNFNGYSNATNLYGTSTSSMLSSNNNLVSAANVETSSTSSTVNLNVLNQDLTQQQQSSFVRSFPNGVHQSKIGILPATSSSVAAPSEDLLQTQVNNNNNNQLAKSHICEICQKSFKRREHLYQHVKLHTGFRPYTCENCNKSFMRKEHLLRHMTSHSGQKNFTCNICEKSFSRNDNLLKHKKTHDKQASYTCDICQKQFVMKHYYLAHKMTHDGGGGGDRCTSLANVWNVLKT